MFWGLCGCGWLDGGCKGFDVSVCGWLKVKVEDMGMKIWGVSEDDLMMVVVVGCRDVVMLLGMKLELKRCYIIVLKVIWL